MRSPLPFGIESSRTTQRARQQYCRALVSRTASGPLLDALLAIVLFESLLVLRLDGLRNVVVRRVLDLLSRKIDVDLAVVQVDRLDPLSIDEHFVTEPPVAGIGDEVAHLPRLVVHDEVVDVADLVVCSAAVIAIDLL